MHLLLIPLSWIYGLCISVRNFLFNKGFLQTRSFPIPVISVGNITICGTGKTPHTEYLVELLKNTCNIAVLSRGYMRKTKGYVLANDKTGIDEIGDESLQMHIKHPDIKVAVCENRCEGIDQLIKDEKVEAVILDDAYQHRYVKPGINILLVDSQRMISNDMLLPAGTLREPYSAKKRADIVIVTKCKKDVSPIDIRVMTNQLRLFAFQELFFSTLDYYPLRPIFKKNTDEIPLEKLRGMNVLLITGIGAPEHIIDDLEPYGAKITSLHFRDHHQFTERDIYKINENFTYLPSPKIVITTEKDCTRLCNMHGFSDDVRKSIYTLPIKISFLLGQQEKFNKIIKDYVHKDARNSSVVEKQDDHKSENSNNSGNGPRTISFRDN